MLPIKAPMARIPTSTSGAPILRIPRTTTCRPSSSPAVRPPSAATAARSWSSRPTAASASTICRAIRKGTITPASVGATGALSKPAISADGHVIAFWELDDGTPGGPETSLHLQRLDRRGHRDREHAPSAGSAGGLDQRRRTLRRLSKPGSRAAIPRSACTISPPARSCSDRQRARNARRRQQKSGDQPGRPFHHLHQRRGADARRHQFLCRHLCRRCHRSRRAGLHVDLGAR